MWWVVELLPWLIFGCLPFGYDFVVCLFCFVVFIGVVNFCVGLFYVVL